MHDQKDGEAGHYLLHHNGCHEYGAAVQGEADGGEDHSCARESFRRLRTGLVRQPYR